MDLTVITPQGHQTFHRGDADPRRETDNLPLVPMARLQPWQRPDALVLTSRACALPIAVLNKLRTQTRNQLQAVQLNATTPDFLIPNLRDTFELLISVTGIAGASAIQLLS